MSPRRRRAVVLAACTSCFAGGFLPLQQHLAHGHHPALFSILYVLVVATPLAFAIVKLAKLRKEEDCSQA